MGKSVETRERVTQKSAGIRMRQLEFINWAEDNEPNFDWNKLIRDKLDEQIKILNPTFLKNEQII
ncbi:MAG: hypothetical protein IIA87_03540 [Nanoarchaeota archaeon]|nr:hypothetical protein [Nanoarchaeota archaeon]